MQNRQTRLMLTALGLFAIATSAHAQAPTRPQFGALLGVSSTTITDTDFSGLDGDVSAGLNTKRRMGFQIGAYLTQPLSGALSVQPELHYIQKGAKLDFDVNDPELDLNGSVTLKLSYVEVPVLLRYDAGQGSRLRPFVVAGPAFAYRVACTLGIESSEFSADQDCDAADDQSSGDDDQFKKFDVGGIVGVGLQGQMGGRALSAQLRYSRGFVNIARDAGDQSPRNTGISLLFGIGF